MRLSGAVSQQEKRLIHIIILSYMGVHTTEEL